MSKRQWSCLSYYLGLALVLVGLLTLSVPPSEVRAEPVVTFPDHNLEVAIREAVGKPAGPIYLSDVSSSTFATLDAQGRSIDDLAGLQYCTSLRYLDLYSNQIGNLSPLSALTGLRYLRLGQNQISDVSPVAGLTNLTALNLLGNQISDISPLSGLTSLTELHLYGNQIGDISPLSALTGLRILRLGENQISDISPVAGLTNLTLLHLLMNQIGDISPLSGLTGLRDLHLHVNKVSDISPLASLTSLTELHLGDNQIRDIEPLVDNLGIGSGDVVDVSTNPLNCESQHQYIPLLKARGVTLDWEITNEMPAQPSNRSPANRSVGVSLTPTLKSSDFFDPDMCDTCAASQWQVTSQSGDYSSPVFDSGVDASHLIRIKIPSLSRDATYYWRVRHQDGLGAWSIWSVETSFATRTHAGGVPFWIWPIASVAVVTAIAGGFLFFRRKAKPS